MFPDLLDGSISFLKSYFVYCIPRFQLNYARKLSPAGLVVFDGGALRHAASGIRVHQRRESAEGPVVYPWWERMFPIFTRQLRGSILLIYNGFRHHKCRFSNSVQLCLLNFM